MLRNKEWREISLKWSKIHVLVCRVNVTAGGLNFTMFISKLWHKKLITKVKAAVSFPDEILQTQ